MAAGATPGTRRRPARRAARSPIDEDLGVAGDGQVGLDLDAAGAVERDAERAGQRRGGDAGRPEDGPARDPLVADRDALGVDRRDHRAGADLDAEGFELPAGRLADSSGT